VNGGSYTVAKENLGTWASLFAAAALMIDYVLTVAVGISAGVAAVVSAAPQLHKYTVPMCLGVLLLITLLNLRGTGEAGIAAPTLEQVRTPYREFITPLLKHIEVIKERYPNRLLAVIIPEIVEMHWWFAFLHSRRASRLRAALRARQDGRVIVIDLPWFIKE
jgi:hypothetical protein